MTKPPPHIPYPPDPLTDTVIKADLIVLGTITDKKYDVVTIESGNVTGKFTYTIFTLSVEKVIKGDPNTTQVFIKTIGGEEVGSHFLIRDRILTLLNHENDNVYTVLGDGIQWFESPSARANSVVKLQDAMGRIAKNMLAQDIPISLDEPIPMPAEPVKRPEEVKLPDSIIPESKDNPPSELPESYLLEQQALLAAGWNNLMTENFEGVFPSGDWAVYGNPTWDDDNYKPHYGYWSAWCANGGAGGLDPQYSNYPNNMDGWMIYGPFDLSSATAAAVDFYWWNRSELNYDYLEWHASADGTNFYGFTISGNWQNWYSQTFDLSNVPVLGSVLGDDSVWIALT